MDAKEASEKIAECLRLADKAIKEAERIADEANISFNWSGPTYGMGGYYRGTKSDNEWESSDEGWQASSHSC